MTCANAFCKSSRTKYLYPRRLEFGRGKIYTVFRQDILDSPLKAFKLLRSSTKTWELIASTLLIVIGVFLYYFIGLVISRFGSLVIEPLLKYFSFLKFADYKNFVAASKKDKKIELLSEVNNTYRTLSSLFVLQLLLKLYDKIEGRFPVLQECDAIVLLVLLLVLFLLSYRKQTSYITKRIEVNE